MATMTSPTIKDVLDQELEQVEASRRLRLGGDKSRPAAGDSLIGLAFSGGGIRSATFNLGILQALAHQRLLRAFDYISTVSGGGYIGGWLMAWMHHQNVGIQTVEERLSAAPEAPSQSADPPEVHFLRDYSNYLTPRKGALSTDFWAFAAGYLRNTLLNQAILVLAFLSLLLAPRTFVHLIHLLEDLEEALRGQFPDAVQAIMESQYFALGLGLGCALLALIFIGRNLVSVDPGEPSDHPYSGIFKTKREKRDCWYTKSWAVQVLIVVPLLLAAGFFAYSLGESPTEWHLADHPWSSGPLLGSILYFGQWMCALLFRGKTTAHDSPKAWVILVSAAVAGGITGYLFIEFARILVPAGTTFNVWHGMTFGVPLMVGMMLIAGVLHIGLMGTQMIDKHREWWGRLGGLLMIYAASWLVLFLIAVYFPASLRDFLCSHQGITVSGVLVWVASTAYGVAFGKSDLSGVSILNAPYRQRLWHYLARVTPYIFVLGVLLGLSLLASAFCAWITGHGETLWSFPSDLYFSPAVPLACVLLLVASVALSWRVDINEFSIHYLYRNRLVRCYLGASVPGRSAQPFTGFSDRDNFPLTTLQIPVDSDKPEDARPLPILNTSLNVVHGKELALQTRKARSFAFTPLYGGFTRILPESSNWESFFGPTKEAGCQRPTYRDGITLGTSVAISGAAASPNMGSYSEAGLAFLMTLFDVRLGWWAGNPSRMGKPFDFRKLRWGNAARKWWRRGSPLIGFFSLLCELLGSTSDDSNFLYLSDGGHFENLGIYELVRRRCKLIVACDVSCDGSYKLADLHNAMERCRTDFGVRITLGDEAQLKPTGPPDELRSKRHFLTGTIHYPGSPRDEGTIIYIKSTLVDGDPQDVLAYNKVNRHFPHDTTANQWFDEAHFENYRALGEAAGKSAIKAIKDAIKHTVGYSPD